MQGFAAERSVILLVAGAVVMGSLAVAMLSMQAPAPTPLSTMGFWEAAGRGLVTAVTVNETFREDGHTVTWAAGIRVTNSGSVPVAVSEEAVLMNPHASQSPAPNPLDTTQDVVLTVGTIPAGGSVLYSYGPDVVRGFLPGPSWWCMEQMQSSKAGVVFRVGGETLPSALRPLVENPFFHSPTDDTQSALWASLRAHPSVVVGKQPLWGRVNGSAGQTVRVRIDATNLAVWSTDDAFAQNVNVTHGAIIDDVPAGWKVEEGSFSVRPDVIVSHTDGSQTLTWYAALPAAQVSLQGNPSEPTGYATATRFYTLVAPRLDVTAVTLPRARSDMSNTGPADAQSAAPVISVVVGTPSNRPPFPDAGGPYTGIEGDTILLNASKSHDPDGAPLQFRWSYTDNGTWDTSWSSSPTAAVRYTDEFSGYARVAVTNGHTTASARAAVTIANVPPVIRNLTATASADFRLVVAGTKSNTVTLTVRANGTVLATLRVDRQPGDPRAQSRDTGMLTMNLSEPISVTLGLARSGECAKGDNPTWVNVTFPDGRSSVLFHNLKARHEDEHDWHSGDLRPFFFAHGITLRANLYDPGADTLTAHWEFGDGTNQTQVFLNGPTNDAPERPVGGNAPTNVTALVVHSFRTNGHAEDEFEEDGTFTVTLTVTDGDGAVATASLTLPCGFHEGCEEDLEDD